MKTAAFPRSRTAGFTLVEVLIAMSLALTILTAVLSSYLFLGRNFARLALEQTLEAQGRNAVLMFEKDARSATEISSPSATGVTFTVPAGSASNSVAYSYNSTDKTLLRSVNGATATVIVRNVVTPGASFRFFDKADREYTTFTNYLSGISKVSLTFSTQTGDALKGTLTPAYRGVSARVILLNKAAYN
jgi:prepilin-type N-terminal cleavage/methylation domain-containing protein